jgi:hypothetical protein
MSIMSIYKLGYESDPAEPKKQFVGTRPGGMSYAKGGKVTSKNKTKHRAKTSYGRHSGY